MKVEKVLEVIRKYDAELAGVATPEVWPENKRVDIAADVLLSLLGRDRESIRGIANHLRSMFQEMEKMIVQIQTIDCASEDEIQKMIGKLMRWLGFAQGVLWLAGYKTLTELKAHNKTTTNTTTGGPVNGGSEGEENDG
jgi:hypothetical protein